MDLARLGWNQAFSQHLKELRGKGLAPGKGFSPGRVVRHDRKRYLIQFEQGLFATPASGRMAFRSGEDTPVVGDWVAAQVNKSRKNARITALLPRFSKISRRAPGQVNREQVLAANIDLIFLVSGLDGDYNPRRIERAMAMAWDSGAKPIVLLNKADLHPEPESAAREVEEMHPDVPVLVLSALRDKAKGNASGKALEAVRSHLAEGVTATFIGSSGVGKSTILNRLLGYEHMRTSEVREDDSRGRHTTTHRELVLLEGGGALIDTPGIRELQLWGDPDKILGAFPDIAELAGACRFRDCRHEGEPDCAVNQALDQGRLDEQRFANFLKLREEMEELARTILETGKEDGGKELKRFSRSYKNQSKYTPTGA